MFRVRAYFPVPGNKPFKRNNAPWFDAFDAITNDQPYRDALPVEAARDEIHAKAGLDFDPEVAETFLTLELPEQHHPEL